LSASSVAGAHVRSSLPCGNSRRALRAGSAADGAGGAASALIAQRYVSDPRIEARARTGSHSIPRI
jgi:hypothetical protein